MDEVLDSSIDSTVLSAVADLHSTVESESAIAPSNTRFQRYNRRYFELLELYVSHHVDELQYVLAQESHIADSDDFVYISHSIFLQWIDLLGYLLEVPDAPPTISFESVATEFDDCVDWFQSGINQQSIDTVFHVATVEHARSQITQAVPHPSQYDHWPFPVYSGVVAAALAFITDSY